MWGALKVSGRGVWNSWRLLGDSVVFEGVGMCWGSGALGWVCFVCGEALRGLWEGDLGLKTGV